jgi:predicted SnoaL-like aldol condensation-catalyzing enzyme
MNTSRTRRFAPIIALGLLLGLLTPLAASARVDLDSDPGSPVRLSNYALTSRLFDAVFNDGDVDAASVLVSDVARIHTPYGVFTGPSGLQDYLDIIRHAYPDASFAVSSIDVEGDAVTVRWTMTATRFAIGPNEPELDVAVRRSGETTITVADGQVAGITQIHRATATTQSTDVAFMDGPSE